MAWETRGTHTYYYKKERIGKNVKSVYVGCDEGAHNIAHVDDLLRHIQREAEKQKKDNLNESPGINPEKA